MGKPKLGLLGDFVGSGTGFGEVLLNISNNLLDRYEISQLAINYAGDYTEHQKDIRLYTCGGREDPYGFRKIHYYLERENPDVILVLNDPWIADKIILKIREKHPELPAVLYTPVDSDGIHSSYVSILNMYDHIVAYTEYGKGQLQQTGLEKPCTVIPHGVDIDTYYPVDKAWARKTLSIEDRHRFIVGYVGQNQPRKKVDHFIWIISEWLKKYPHDDVAFYYHGPIYRPGGINVPQYIQYLDTKNPGINLADRFIYTSDKPNFIASRDLMRIIFGIFDLFFQAAANEGLDK